MPSAAPSKEGASAFFLRRNWQIIYAAVLIVLVPVTIMLNTFFVVKRFRQTVDAELQRTALIIGKMINVTGGGTGDATALQKRIEDVAAAVSEIKSLDILAKEGDDFKIVAGLAEEDIGKIARGNQNVLSWYNNQPIAYLTKAGGSAAQDKLTAEEIRNRERYWGVVMPLTSNGQKTYLLSAKISLAAIDDMVRANLFWSYILLSVTVLIIILILASNTRLFQYAALFKRLKEVDKMKDDFISMASHELRAPITAIRGYLSLFLEDSFGKFEGKPRSIMQTTFQIATHLGSLVEDLLDVSRIEQGRMKMTLEDVSVDETATEIVQQLHFDAEKKKLVFEFKPPAAPLRKIRVDQSRFKQVLINLCSNAIKYTPAGSVIVTAEAKEPNTVEIKITDTGIGMSAEAREKLFQKFYRIRTDDTISIPGTGLGLWITKQIVELMGGKIFVDSIEKVGTQASVIFPAAAAQEPPAPAEAAAAKNS